jgi:hypothetical protein
MSAKLFVGHLLQDNADDGITMVEDIEDVKKRCPLCKKEYPGRNNYCGADGSRLEEPGRSRSSKARMARDADSGAWSVSGQPEEG